jgi:uncharacterized protein YcfJ
MQVGEDDAMNTTDVATKTAKVVAVGPITDTARRIRILK